MAAQSEDEGDTMSDPTPGANPPEQPYVAPPQPYSTPPAYGEQQPAAPQPPYPTQPQYGEQPAPYYPPAAPEQRTNTLSIIALILGILVPVGGIVTGHIALNQIKRTGEAGHGLALTGTILGYVFTAGYIILFIFWILIVLVTVQQGTYTGYTQ